MNHSLISRLNPASILLVTTVAAVSCHSPALAASGFTIVFAPSNFTLTNDNADGSVNTTNAATGTVVLTGGNNGSFNPGTTTWISLPITQGGTVSFAWSFTGDDFPYDGSVGDRGGYIINDNPTYIATQNGDSSTVSSLSLTAGQTFGFIVETANNDGYPGVLTINSFDFNPDPEAIPEPLTILGTGVVLGALPILKRQYAKRNKKKDKNA